MLEHAKRRTHQFLATMEARNIDTVLLTDESSIAYFAGFWGYLGVEFGRPTFLLLRRSADPVVITPQMESEMVSNMTWIEQILPWSDEGTEHWGHVLRRAVGNADARIYVEKPVLPGLVRDFLDETWPGTALEDISCVIGAQRTIKSAEEIEVMKQAGRIGSAMMDAARNSLGPGVREYEVALAVLDAGTRAAAGFLTGKGWEAYVSPVIHNLQIMQSGHDTAMVHRRASIRPLEHKDPVYFCFCNLLEFKHYRLGFDRMFFVGEATDEARRLQQTAIDAQQAALSNIRAGVKAAEVAEAANAVYRERGFESGYRTGRSIGVAYLETPELKQGDETVLQSGMTFAVDGGVTVPNQAGGRIGDSIVVTGDGFEFLTDYPRELAFV